VRTADDIDNELETMKYQLKEDIKKKSVKIDDLENEIETTGKCIWWEAVLSLGFACVANKDAADEIKVIQG